MGYSTRDVASLLGLPERRIRAYARAGLITPARGPRNSYLYSFQDLVLLRAAAELSRANVPVRRIGEALARLKRQLPQGRSLSELRIHAAGDEVVVRESSEPPWNPQSGQFHIEFDVADLAAQVAPLARGVSERAHAQGDERAATEWFELGIELEPVAPEEARAAYEQALRQEPALTDARVNLGRLLHDAGMREEAEAQYRQVLAVREHALAAYNLGVLLEDTNRDVDAIKAYARAIAADPALAEAHFNLARIYEQRGDQRAAIRHFNGYRALVRPQ
ncbi:MAG: tetratricopeptide repeat protein [Gemmatimonadetes bacterium]|nr:tetratricopeptide repeat protein [Gemmatimonadota bacterium]